MRHIKHIGTFVLGGKNFQFFISIFPSSFSDIFQKESKASKMIAKVIVDICSSLQPRHSFDEIDDVIKHDSGANARKSVTMGT